MRPVLEGACQYIWLKDGTVDLEDVARMNDALDIQVENQKRYQDSLDNG